MRKKDKEIARLKKKLNEATTNLEAALSSASIESKNVDGFDLGSESPLNLFIQCFKKKYNISGPYPADTIFLKDNRKKFDVIIGMYHDQVLTPLKTLVEYDAINITLGLPFIRVSPDHGPNETMLGKNLSNPLSLSRAIKFLDKN